MSKNRIEAERALLRLHFSTVEYKEAGGLHWFRVEKLMTPDRWSPDAISVAFSVTQGFPGAEPYGFYVPADLTFNGQPPSDHKAPHQPPFDGSWRFLSWNPVDWRAAADINSGSNLWAWVRSFLHRLREGK